MIRLAGCFDCFLSTSILLASFSIAACTSSPSIELMASGGQQSIVRDGSKVLISAKQNVIMIKVAQGIRGDRPAFAILISNMTENRIDFDPLSIIASYRDDGGIFRKLRVYSYDELVAEERNRQALSAIVVGLAAVSNNMQAAQSGYSNSTGTFNAYDNYGNRASGTYSSNSYDSYRAFNAQQLANAQSSQEFAQIRNQGEANLNQLQGTILKANTILPRESVGGMVVIDPPKFDKTGNVLFQVSINVAGENHTFMMQSSRH